MTARIADRGLPVFLLMGILSCVFSAGYSEDSRSQNGKPVSDGPAAFEKLLDPDHFEDLAALRHYIARESLPISQGIVFRLRLETVSVAQVPISVPDKTADEVRRTRYIHGRISNESCDIVLDDDQARTIETLKTARRGLFGIVWEKPTLTDDEFSNGICGFFPLCFSGDELRLWPMDVVLACVSPFSLNVGPAAYAISLRSGITVLSSSPVRKEFLFGTKFPDGPEERLELDCTDSLPACSFLVRGVNECSSCQEGRYAALGCCSKYFGKKVPLGERYAVYDHAHVQLFNGIEFHATIEDVKLLPPSESAPPNRLD